MNKLILGSGSPRRAQLLKEMGFDFSVKTSDILEEFNPEHSAMMIAQTLAEKKSKAIRLDTDEVILTADTVVSLGEKVLGKPEGLSEAFEMLRLLSGQVHQVITGICLRSDQEFIESCSLTHVKFKKLGRDEINYYIANFKPLDKAGAYGIQEWLGQIGIEWLDGSYYNVVGLPTEMVYEFLTQKFQIYPKK